MEVYEAAVVVVVVVVVVRENLSLVTIGVSEVALSGSKADCWVSAVVVVLFCGATVMVLLVIKVCASVLLITCERSVILCLFV